MNLSCLFLLFLCGNYKILNDVWGLHFVFMEWHWCGSSSQTLPFTNEETEATWGNNLPMVTLLANSSAS